MTQRTYPSTGGNDMDSFIALWYTFLKVIEREIGDWEVRTTVSDTMVYEEYSSDRYYRFEVYQCHNFYQIWIQKKVTDDYMGDDWLHYHNISDYMHIADSMERAIEIGRECLCCLM